MSTLPKMALPSGAPVLECPKQRPTPALSLESSAKAAEATATIVSPVPIPTITDQAATKPSPDERAVVLPMASPTPSTRKPPRPVSGHRSLWPRVLEGSTRGGFRRQPEASGHRIPPGPYP